MSDKKELKQTPGPCVTAWEFANLKKLNMEQKVKQLQEGIYNKFGNVRAFCAQTGANYHTTTNLFNGRIAARNIEAVYMECKRLFERTKAVKCAECINNKDAEGVRIALVTRWKTVTNFCQAYPGFSQTFVHNVITGKRKSKDGRYANLLKALKIKQQQKQ